MGCCCFYCVKTKEALVPMKRVSSSMLKACKDFNKLQYLLVRSTKSKILKAYCSSIWLTLQALSCKDFNKQVLQGACKSESLACKGKALDCHPKGDNQALRACMVVLFLKSKILIKIITLLFLRSKNKRSIWVIMLTLRIRCILLFKIFDFKPSSRFYVIKLRISV